MHVGYFIRHIEPKSCSNKQKQKKDNKLNHEEEEKWTVQDRNLKKKRRNKLEKESLVSQTIGIGTQREKKGTVKTEKEEIVSRQKS